MTTTGLFVDRLREADFDPDSLEPIKLEAGLGTLLADLSGPDLLSLVDLAHRRHSGAEFEQRFREQLRQHVETFPLRGQAELVEVCAAQGVIDGMRELPTNHRVVLALVVRSSSFVGVRPAHPDVRTEADAALAGDAVAVRTPPQEPRLAKAPRSLADAVAAARRDEADLTDSARAVAELATEQERMRKAMVSVYSYSSRMRRLADEAGDIMWWLLSKGSLTQGAPLSALTGAAATVAVAMDLASVTRFLPGPVSADQLLTAALDEGAHEPTDEVKLPEVISAARELNALPEVLNDVSLTPKRPLLLAIGGDDSVEGLPDKCRRLDASRQVYDELLMASAWQEL